VTGFFLYILIVFLPFCLCGFFNFLILSPCSPQEPETVARGPFSPCRLLFSLHFFFFLTPQLKCLFFVWSFFFLFSTQCIILSPPSFFFQSRDPVEYLNSPQSSNTSFNFVLKQPSNSSTPSTNSMFNKILPPVLASSLGNWSRLPVEHPPSPQNDTFL